MSMNIINERVAKNELYKLIDRVYMEHKPIFITGKRYSAVLISEEDWLSIQKILCIPSDKCK